MSSTPIINGTACWTIAVATVVAVAPGAAVPARLHVRANQVQHVHRTRAPWP
jgi:hypothetical protein